MDNQPNNPLHGITLKTVVTELVERYGFEYLGQRIRIKCFTDNPSIQSSLKFLRKTPWAREKVEYLYIRTFLKQQAPAVQQKAKCAPSSASASEGTRQVFDWATRSVR